MRTSRNRASSLGAGFFRAEVRRARFARPEHRSAQKKRARRSLGLHGPGRGDVAWRPAPPGPTAPKRRLSAYRAPTGPEIVLLTA